MTSKWVTIQDGGETDRGCLNCRTRTDWFQCPDKCSKCGAELEDCRDEHYVILRAEDGSFPMIYELAIGRACHRCPAEIQGDCAFHNRICNKALEKISQVSIEDIDKRWYIQSAYSKIQDFLGR